MNKKVRLYQGIALLFICIVFFLKSVDAQPHPGQNGDSTYVGGPPVNGSAPLGSGLLIMMVLGAGYGAKKIYKSKQNEKNNM
ncbi:MAG: hypothetical protein KAG99_07170 [Bacteroidales bacterium]|nr:hypothetical protein [Bacteroidales bacterium]